jgi:hypothetical protein
MTCVALAVVLWQTQEQIGPMRAEIVRLRTETGRLTIDDPAKINAIQVNTGDTLSNQWRIYLPPERKYRVFCASGYLPDQQGPTFNAWRTFTQPMRDAGTAFEDFPTLRDFWFDQVVKLGTVAEVGPPNLSGEITLKALLVAGEDAWRLELQPGGSTPIQQPNSDWLSDGRTRGAVHGDIPKVEQSTHPAEQRLLLMHMRRPVITESPGSWSSTSPVGDADSIVVWIEPEAVDAAPADRSSDK